MPRDVVFIIPGIGTIGENVSGNAFPAPVIDYASFIHERCPSANISFLDLDMEHQMHPAENYNDLEVLKRALKGHMDNNTKFPNARACVVLSCLTSYHYIAMVKILRVLHELVNDKSISKPIIVAGGYVPSMKPDAFRDLGIDVILQGHFEVSLLQIIEDSTDTGFAGLVSTMRVIAGKHVQFLDELPPTCFDLYQPYLELYSRINISLSRGCPFGCVFCIENRFSRINEPRPRWCAFSPARAMQAIEAAVNISDTKLKNCSEKKIGFYDAIFGLDVAWRKKILKGIVEKQYDYEFKAESRVDMVNKNHLQLFKDAGFALTLGLESASPRMLSLMNKTRDPRGYLANLKSILAMAKSIDYGPLFLNLLLNFPGEDAISIEETYSFLETIIQQGVAFITNNRFYNMHPGDGIYSKLEEWSLNYGTRVYYKTWWKDESTVPLGTIIDASKTLDFKTATSMYKEKTRHVYQACIENVEDFKTKMLLLKRIAIEGALMVKQAHHYEECLAT